MGLLEDFAAGVNDASRAVGDFIGDVGRDAQGALDASTRNVAQFANSGFNGREVIGPLGDKFGHAPVEFVLNVASRLKSQVRQLLSRVATRAGRSTYTIDTPQGKRTITARPLASASAAQVGLTFAVACITHPGEMIEESGRMASGLPVKTGRGLNGSGGFTVFPFSLPGGSEERGLFGVDDAIILTLVVPIVVGFATGIIPALIAAAGAAISGEGDPGKIIGDAIVSGGKAPLPNPNLPPPVDDPVADALATVQANAPIVVAVVVVVVAVVVLVVVAKKKRHAA